MLWGAVERSGGLCLSPAFVDARFLHSSTFARAMSIPQTTQDGSSRLGKDGSPVLALAEAEQVIEALNEAIALEGEPVEKARHLLRRCQELLGHDADLELILVTDLKRPVAPLMIERVFVGPTFDRIEPRPHSEVQAAMDASEPMWRIVIPYVLSNPRSPHTLDLAEVPNAAWFEQVSEKFVRPHGWVNFNVAVWSASEDRLIMLALPQRVEQPAWSPEAKRLLGLMLRAVAPIVDREMFKGLGEEQAGDSPVELPAAPGAALEGKDLSGRQTDVLHLLLRGMSEKEAARELGVSTHTVHTHVKKLYAQFGVSSRGELLAKFVDQRVLKMMA